MKRFRAQVSPEERFGVRGGAGRAVLCPYVQPGEMAGVEFVSLVTLDPAASIGEHLHPAEEELYLVLEGQGEALLDGERFAVGPRDAFLCKAGHTHGLHNTGAEALTFLAVLVKVRKA